MTLPVPNAVPPPRPAPSPSKSRGELGARAASALVLMVLAIGTAWVGGHVFTLFWLAAASAVLWEWQGLVGGPRRPERLLIGGSALAGAAPLASGGLALPALAVLAAGAVLLAWRAEAGARLWDGAGLVYAGALAVAVCLLRHSFPDGVESILWLFAVVWGTDVMAYFGGRLIGGPKLAPRLSPSKTWSGFVVGVGSGALLGLGVVSRPVDVPVFLALGLAGGAVAQAGDLFESALKRRFGVKDSGSLIPGHGGVMDRLDGFVAASVVAAAFGAWRFGAEWAGAGLMRW